MRFNDITDGTSNTIMLVEVKPELAVPWTAPFDYSFAPAKPMEGLMIGADGQFIAAIGDGSVLLLSNKLSDKTMLHLFQMNDGNVVSLISPR